MSKGSGKIIIDNDVAGAENFEPSNPRTLEPSNPRTLEPSNPRTLEPSFLFSPDEKKPHQR